MVYRYSFSLFSFSLVSSLSYLLLGESSDGPDTPGEVVGGTAADGQEAAEVRGAAEEVLAGFREEEDLLEEGERVAVGES